MPVLQTSRLPYEHEYFLDGACESDELDAGSAIVLNLYGDRRRIIDILDSSPAFRDRGFLSHRRSSTRALFDYATEILQDVDPHQIGGAVYKGLVHMAHASVSVAEFCARRAIADSVEGGCGEPFNRPPHAERDGVTPWKRTRRRLVSPSYIRRYVRHMDEVQPLRALTTLILSRGVALSDDLIVGNTEAFEAERTLQRQRQRDYEQRQWAQVLAARGVETRVEKQLRKRHKVIRKAVVMAEALVGSEAVRRLARSEPVVLLGQQMDFRISLRGSLGSVGHDGLDVGLVDKTGDDLAGLCLYFEGLPALDQVTAIQAYLDAGLERELINAGNLYAVTPAGVGHPALIRKRELPFALNMRPIRVGEPDIQELRHDRDEAYWQRTKAMWLEATATFVLGRRGLRLAPAVANLTQ